MQTNVFRFHIAPCVPLDEVEMTLHLSIFAVEGLVGSARIRLDFSYYVDASHGMIFVDGTTEVGSAIVRVFTNLLSREFGDGAFLVKRIRACQHQPQKSAV